MSIFGRKLHDAVWEEDSKRVRMILMFNKTAVHAKGRDGGTPLHWAARKGCVEVATLLIGKGADVNARDEREKTPLHWAATWKQKRMAELLLGSGARSNAKDDCGWTPLHDVRSKEIAELLVANGADVHVKGGRVGGDWTPLMNNTAARNSTDVLRVLLVNGADVNTKDARGTTPLHKAVYQCSEESVTLLLDFKADVNAQGEGGTPLRLARSKGYAEIAEILRRHGGHE